MLKRKKATIQRAMQGSGGLWSAIARIDGTKSDVSLAFGSTEPVVGRRVMIEGSGTSWTVV